MRKGERNYEVVSPGAEKHKTDENLLASLPLDVSFMILDKLLESTDHLSFAGVCKYWCSISRGYNVSTQRWHKKGMLLPLFLVSTESDQTGKTRNHELEAYDVCSGNICKDNIQLPVTHGKGGACGSSHGWLAIWDIEGRRRFSITLVHSFQKSVEPIKLPLLDSMMDHFWGYDIRRVILSSDPILNPDSYVVVVLYGGFGSSNLYFLKEGQQQWTYIDRQCWWKDVIFYRNQVYAVYAVCGGDWQESVMSFDVHSCNNPSHPPKAINRTPNIIGSEIGSRWWYLVESAKGDHLWYVKRLSPYESTVHKHIERFRVYKVMFDDKDGSVVEQEEVHSIGDEALFVGYASESISVSASRFPGCKPNSIYYTTEETFHFEKSDHKPYHIFCLDDGNIKEYNRIPRLMNNSVIPNGVWILPKFKGLF